MIKVSHESPLSMLGESREYNDYDYALVHLFEKYPKYLQFFEESLRAGRTVYLDNSIFELGEAFDHSRYVHWIEHLQAIAERCGNENFYYIVPDVFHNSKQTQHMFESFEQKFNKGKRIGVVQGDTLEGMLECFLFMKERCDIVAINFSSPVYQELGDGGSNLLKQMNGRIEFINTLQKSGLFEGVKVHLLGCALPQEFAAYAHPEIVSLDTSNPIVHGLLGIEYNSGGLDDKSSVKLIDLIESKPDGKVKEIIYGNIHKFRSFLEG